MTEKTCGPLYLEAAEQYSVGDRERYRAFSAGFIGGQAEKIYLGACAAAMFRPSPEHWEMVKEILDDVCPRYGLEWLAHPFEGEFWMFHPDATEEVNESFFHEKNSVSWHGSRGSLCGIPLAKIDYQFHERSGHGERCDPTRG